MLLFPISELCAHKESHRDFPGGSDGKSVCLQCGRPGFNPWIRKILWRRKWQPNPVLLPGKSHGRSSPVGYSHGVAKSRTRLSNLTCTFKESQIFPNLFVLAVLVMVVQLDSNTKITKYEYKRVVTSMRTKLNALKRLDRRTKKTVLKVGMKEIVVKIKDQIAKLEDV